ncbi:ribosome quality control complex subunit TCF25 [Anopheles ziemanni]|uniref:ribosome quality control complex subunit TCF25 n=1 Tax=Anopheles coustani TaxID=139045 RepID=UPI0026581129|nr:ribosome quality control complex subunit TCF25 [Anopheles coustani]XP_058178702.1 ribosome quality control complex subunit TCF25 [Anopheles ziemanni]
MSYRILRKLQGNELEIKEQIDEVSDGGDADYDTNSTSSQNRNNNKKQLNINRYDLLNQQQSLSESEVKEDDNDETEKDAADGAVSVHLAEAKKRKKKKKKKTGKYISSSARRSSEDNADIEDDFTRTVKEVDKLFGTCPRDAEQHHHHHHHRAAESATSMGRFEGKLGPAAGLAAKSLLNVQHKNLNPQYEMKRMFGSKVVGDQQNKRRNVRGGARMLKSTYLVNPKDSWPPVGKSGIYMNLVQAPEPGSSTSASGPKAIFDKNVIYFAFEHSPSYRQIQQKFLDAVESMDSENIIRIIKQHPYHVDSLIQLSELCKMSEDHAMASELIEHALLALESSFHTMFSLTQGNCRLDYRRQENRALFITLFKHSQHLESRACSRTALEVAKLILSFDPVNDPLAIILIVDYYAIRAKQYEWLVTLYEEWEATNNLSQLPNMAYSYAMALFHLNRTDEADKALQYALLMFPGVLRPLMDELSIQADSRVAGHNHFGPNAYNKALVALQQLMSLYVCRSKLVWRDTELLPWLDRNVHEVLNRVDNKEDVVAEYATKRSQRYSNPPRQVLRHIVLSDFKEKVPLAQFIKRETDPVLMYDPLPPLDSINIYTRPTLTPTGQRQSNDPLHLFFQSLLPSFSAQPQPPQPPPAPQQQQPANVVQNQAPEGQQAGAGAAAAGAGGTERDLMSLQAYSSTLNTIVDAMREFLSGIRALERPNDADVDEAESTEEDEPNDYLT